MSVVDAVTRDLEALRRVAPELADSTMAATALALAAEVDADGTSATAKSMCARVIVDICEQLRALTPEREEKEDRLVDLAARRAVRRARGSAA